MICPSCATAGDRNQLANKTLDDSLRYELQRWAREHHLYCPGGCDCQHVVGMVINNGQPS